MENQQFDHHSIGTVIFQSLKNNNAFNQAVRQSGALLPQDVMSIQVNHVGLYLGDHVVIAATQHNGVITQPLNDFLMAADCNIVAKVKDELIAEKAVYCAMQYLGLPYNHSFSPDAKGLYCSQLITDSFLTDKGERYFQRYPMNFCDENYKVLSYWIHYYQQLNKNIPQGLLGSHPQQLLRQKELWHSVVVLD